MLKVIGEEAGNAFVNDIVTQRGGNSSTNGFHSKGGMIFRNEHEPILGTSPVAPFAELFESPRDSRHSM